MSRIFTHCGYVSRVAGAWHCHAPTDERSYNERLAAMDDGIHISIYGYPPAQYSITGSSIYQYIDTLDRSMYDTIMAKVDFRRLSGKELIALDTELEKALRDLPSSAMATTLRQFLTQSERVMIGRRIRIAKYLLSGQSHKSICVQMHVGLSTVQAVDRWLRVQFDEYKSVFPPLYDDMKKKRSGQVIWPEAFRSLRKKYPLHCLLFSLLFE